jgi:hypothetical protein
MTNPNDKVELISCPRCNQPIMANGVMLVDSHRCELVSKEWWMEDAYWFKEESWLNEPDFPNLPKIVAEAERRTWEEAKRITKKETVKWYQPNPGSFILDAIKVKLSSLTKK